MCFKKIIFFKFVLGLVGILTILFFSIIPIEAATTQTTSEKCLKCHDEVNLSEFSNSAHGALTCTDCHAGCASTSHGPSGALVRCEKCHHKVYVIYQKSIHGQALAAGVQEAPSCKDCHGEHAITRVTDPSSGVFYKNVPKTCASCHEDQTLIKKYDLPARTLKAYTTSFHGIASRYGKTSAANCASCHGYHDILASTDKDSRVNPDNLIKTCGACHPKAEKYLLAGPIHVAPGAFDEFTSYLEKNIYALVIGFLLLCFLAYMVHNISLRFKKRRQERLSRKKEL